MESLRELNEIVQKPDYKKVGNWMARNITREMALPVTWLFLHFPISANGITFIALLTGVMACALLAVGVKSYVLFGSILLQVWYLLDHVDGQVARYRKEESVTGVFFDYITHHIIHLGIFIGISWGVYRHTLLIIYIFYGICIAAGVLTLNLIADCKYKAFYYWLEKRYLYKRSIGSGIESKNLSIEGDHENKSMIKSLFSFLHKLCEVHVVMNVVTVIAVLQFFVKGYPWAAFMIFYLIIIASVSVSRAAYFIIKGKPDAEFRKLIKMIEGSK